MKTTNDVASLRHDASLLSADDLYLFNEGRNYRTYNQLGARLTKIGGDSGANFAVWAPNARKVSVVGSFNDWNNNAHPLEPRGTSGIWEGFIPSVERGALYKYHIVSNNQGYVA